MNDPDRENGCIQPLHFRIGGRHPGEIYGHGVTFSLNYRPGALSAGPRPGTRPDRLLHFARTAH